MPQNNKIKCGINIDQVYKALGEQNLSFNTLSSYAAFRNLIKSPVLESGYHGDSRRACRIEQEDFGNKVIERIEIEDGKKFIAYLEGIYTVLKHRRLARNKYEFADILAWTGGDFERVEGLKDELGKIGKEFEEHAQGIFNQKRLQWLHLKGRRKGKRCYSRAKIPKKTVFK